MSYTFSQYQESADYIRAKLGSFVPKVAMILGSGLGFLGDVVEDPIRVSYRDIPHFKASTAPGHKGQLVFGTLRGQKVAVMQGRMHHYEGYSYEEVSYAVRVLKLLGCDTLIDVYKRQGQGQADDQLAQGLNDLGHRRGHHVAVPLGVAPEGGEDADEEAGGRDGLDGVDRHAVPLEVGQGLGQEEHDGKADRAQDYKGDQGHVEGAVDLIPPPQGVGLGDALGEGHGKARRGDHQQQVVDDIGVVEVAEALVVQNVPQRDLVEGADELDDGDAHGQDGGAAEEGSFLFTITQWVAQPFAMSLGRVSAQRGGAGRSRPPLSSPCRCRW